MSHVTVVRRAFPAAVRVPLEPLLALHLVAPWYLLLFLQCGFYMVESAIPIAFNYTMNTTIPSAIGIVSTFTASELVIFFVCAIVIVPLIAFGLAKRVQVTRAESEKKKKLAQERQKRNEGLLEFDIKVAAAKLWHGAGRQHWGQKRAADHHGIGVDTLKRLLDRAFSKYNEEHADRPLQCIESFRLLPVTTFETYLTPVEIGRGDTLSQWEFQQIKERYDQRCRSFKDAPQSKLKNDSEEDDFALVINAVFAESRVGKKKSKAEVKLQSLFVCIVFSFSLSSTFRTASFENGRSKWKSQNKAQFLDQIHVVALLAIGAI